MLQPGRADTLDPQQAPDLPANMTADTGLGYDLGSEISSDQPVDGERANWELARLTYESTFESGDYGSQHGRVAMAQWCADIQAASGRRFSPKTGARYKALWSRYPLPGAEKGSWSEAYFEMRGESSKEMHDRRMPSTVSQAPLAVKRAVFQQLARDHDAVEDAVDLTSETARAITDLNHKCAVLLGQHRDQLLGEDPIARKLDREGAASRAERRLRAVRRGQGPTPIRDQIAITPEVRGRALLPGRSGHETASMQDAQHEPFASVCTSRMGRQRPRSELGVAGTTYDRWPNTLPQLG